MDLVQVFLEAFANRPAHPDDISLARRLLTHDDAERIVANAPLATRESLGVVNAVAGDETDHWARNDAAHQRLVRTEDVHEGIAAFFERRAPSWKGR